MRLRPLCVVVLTFLLAPTPGWASDHVASMFGGYSELYASREKGLQFGLEVSWPTDHKIHDHLGILVDAAVHGGTDAAGMKATKAAVLVGLRGLYKVRGLNDRLVLFAHGLIGAHRSQVGGTVNDGLAGGAGLGFDVILGNQAYSGWALRSQMDWVNVTGETSPRASVGLVFRFKESPIPTKP